MLGDITQKGYEKKRSKLIGAYFPQAQGMDAPMGQEKRTPVTPSSSSRYHRRRSSGSRDERYRSDVHTEAVQAALAKHKERKMAVPMPSKRRSLVVQTSMDAYTPPDTSSGSEGDGQGDGEEEEGGDGEDEDGGGDGGTSSSREGSISMEHWITRAIHGTSSTTTTTTSSTASSSSSSTRSGGSGAAGGRLADVLAQHVHISAHHHHHLRHHHHHHHHHHKTEPSLKAFLPSLNILENHSAPPDVTGYTNNTSNTTATTDGIQVERATGASTTAQRQTPKYGNAELMETGDGVPVSSRVSAKIQQLVNTLKRPKRPPLREFFVDDFEELLEVQQPDPNQPKAEGAQMVAMRGEQLGVVTNWPPSLEAALQRWGTISPKAPCLTTMDTNGKPLYVLTYGKLWSRSVKVAYNLLHKLGTKQEPLVRPGDRVALVFPNNDPAAFMTAFYGCLLAEVIPVPIEVPLTRKVTIHEMDAGSQQIGFLLGSCGVTVALTSDACHKGLPKSPTGEIPQFKAKVACVKSRDMHWALVAHRDQRDINLSSLRMLVVADGSNPWSISSCDAFLNVFQTKGLRPEVICPCASSPEALTVAIRRPLEEGSTPPERGILSMQGLSHGVIRVDSEEKLSVLTLQDVGSVMPGGVMCMVKPEGVPQLCKTDEIGELCVCTVATGSSYYGLAGMTKNTFEVFPVSNNGVTVSEYPFTRTGLLGFIGPAGLIFVAGKMDGLMVVGGRRHNADDIVATALAVEPMKFVYRGRIAVFSITVLHDERIVVVAEQRPDSTEEDSFQWMSRVLQAIDSIHQVGVYCLALVPSNTLPKTPLGGIHLSETKQLFLEGALHPCNVLMCPHTCVTNLPKPRQKQPEIGPASVMVGNLVSGKRIAQASGRDLGQIEDNDQARKFLFLSEVLQWRAQTTPDHILYTLLNSRGTIASSLTCVQLHKRAEKIAAMLAERGHLQDGDHVALVYPPGIDLIIAFYGCLYAGCVPITVRPPHPQNIATTLPTVKMIVEVSRSVCVMTTQLISKLLRSKEASAAVDVRTWPPVLDTDDLPKKKPPLLYKPSNPDTLAYLDFSVSTTGMLAGVKMSHTATSAFCRSIKLQCELYPSREVAICLDPYCGLGFVLWCLCSVYSGHQSILIPPSELEVNPALWLSAVSQYKVRDTFCSYSVMELCTKGLGLQTDSLKSRGLDLSRVRTCVVVAEERPRIALTQSFSKLFKDLGLHPRAVSTSFGCRVNLAICLQGTSGPDPTTVYVDMRALRHDRVRLVERGSPHSLPLMESGKILPGVRIIIANPETKGPMGESHLGEVSELLTVENSSRQINDIWVHSGHNASGYFTVYGDEGLQSDHFNSRLSFGDTQTVWARTGAVFTWTNLLVVVVELDGSEQEALDLVPLVTNVVLEEHYLIVGVVVVVDIGVIPINSRGEKQRMHLRDGFLADQLDPIYVAYNM
ncbi:Disco-interacting protein 2 -like protein C [Channa argus]|uniref:Disco-interacting protein 2-like protein C n=1 Tax=Channa argus TaxID=215402 RepID=A0A6G1Q8E4_CHAAH|nr:Disco-interacting protein 2 -like protein C [Channa argus]